MAKTPLIKRLRIQPGQRIAITNPPPGYVEGLGALPEGVQVVDDPDEGTLDLVHLFVGKIAELEKLGPEAMRSPRQGGMLWISYPKRSSKVETDISRDVGWDTIAKAGLRPVFQISIDDVWSALRFRPIDEVGR